MIFKGKYTTVSCGGCFMSMHNGFQLDDYDTEQQAIEALKKHREKQKKPKRKSK